MKATIHNKLFLISALSLFALFSCKNSTDSKLAYTDAETIKDTIKERETDISWTKELEPDRLKKIKASDDRLKLYKIEMKPELMKVLKDYNQPVYPEIEGFGLLNSSVLSKDIKEKVEELCNSISEDLYSGPEIYFNTAYIFNYIFFKNDLIQGWKEAFNIDFPLTEEQAKDLRDKRQKNKVIEEKLKSIAELEKQKTENPDQDVIIPKSDEELILEKIDNIKIFDRWIYGEPFCNDSFIQLPIRFYCKQGSVDVTLYMNKSSSNPVYQITIDRWGTV